MKFNRILKHSLLLFICAIFMSGLTACGGVRIQVQILDRQIETRLSVREGMTVGEALQEAEISINDQDMVTPSVDTALSAENASISIERHAKVTVLKDDKTEEIELTGKRVADALEEAQIALEKNDYINHDLDAYLIDGMAIEVIHRYAVSVSVDGEKLDCLTKAETVKEFLEEQGILLDEKDKLTPDLDSELKDGTRIVVKRVSVKRITEREPIPHDMKVEYSGSMYEDESKEKQSGIDGEKEVVYEVTYVDGKEQSRRVISETVIKEPVAGIVVKGTMARRRIVSREQIFDCDGSGHGYYIITWSDGTVEYQDF